MITYQQNTENINWQELTNTLHDDNFDNGRTPSQLQKSFENSYGVVFARDGDKVVGKARVLSDGVCNAYIVDVWTLSDYRRQGIARKMMELLTENLHGQHVYLWTDDMQDFYESIGFQKHDSDGYTIVVGDWLVNKP
jgi:predicted GNAT family acetyltransferase